jgi:hypothetical protein
MGDPVIMALVVGAAAVVALTIIGRLWGRYRQAAHDARRRAELREQRGFVEKQQRETERLAGRIVATSSTASIAGFTIVRQIEAVFTDGHPTPNRAVEALKAAAAERGANAVINLHSARPPSGKCLAHGDAVIVRPAETETPPAEPLPPLPTEPPPTDEQGST